jgi:hypothetical protein
MEKRLGREPAAIVIFNDLAANANAFRMPALLELAKYYEHRERNYTLAIEFTRTAIQLEDTAELRHREARLERRLSSRRLL